MVVMQHQCNDIRMHKINRSRNAAIAIAVLAVETGCYNEYIIMNMYAYIQGYTRLYKAIHAKYRGLLYAKFDPKECIH